MNAMMTEFVWPIFGRLGTFVSGSLVTYGVAVEHSNSIGLGVAAALFVGVDLLVRRMGKK